MFPHTNITERLRRKAIVNSDPIIPKAVDAACSAVHPRSFLPATEQRKNDQSSQAEPAASKPAGFL